MTIHFQNEQQLWLLPEKAMIWKDKDILIVSDIHLGKLTHFRKNGIAVPRLAEINNYERLSFLILNYHVKRVLILGDLFHSRQNSEWNRFEQFINEFEDVRFDLVMGNHDILDDQKYEHKNLYCHKNGLQILPFSFHHEPVEEENSYVICGHIHPGVKLTGMAKQRLRLPCFIFEKSKAILPAFGTFTGLYTMEPQSHDHVYVVSSDSIMKVS